MIQWKISTRLTIAFAAMVLVVALMVFKHLPGGSV